MVRISVDLPEEVAEALDRAAAEMQSTREALLAQAAEVMLADRDALARSIARGLADFEAGRSHPHEDVMAELETWARDLEARHRQTS
jgi:predicted transcriptional regulator